MNGDKKGKESEKKQQYNMSTGVARMSFEELLKITNFTKTEVDQLTKNFVELSQPNEKIDRAKFRDLLADTFEVDDSLLMDRVFRCFDLDADNYISYDEYFKGMSIFLKGKPEEKIKFCFKTYDLNGDRYISKEEMFQMLKNCLVKGSEEDEDGVKDLVDLVLKKLDEDRDGRVSETDWSGAITKENLLLEAFGKCLPTTRAIEQFMYPIVDIPDPAANGTNNGANGGAGILSQKKRSLSVISSCSKTSIKTCSSSCKSWT